MAVFSIHSLTNHPKDLADHLVITPQAYKSPHFAYKAFPKVVVVLVSAKPTVEYKRGRVFQVKSSLFYGIKFVLGLIPDFLTPKSQLLSSVKHPLLVLVTSNTKCLTHCITFKIISSGSPALILLLP